MVYRTEIDKEIKLAKKIITEFDRLDNIFSVLHKLSSKFDGLNYYALVANDVKKNPNHYKGVKDLTKNLVALKTNNDLFLRSISNIEKLLIKTGVIVVKEKTKYSIDTKKHKVKTKPFDLEAQTVLGYYPDLTKWLDSISKELPK